MRKLFHICFLLISIHLHANAQSVIPMNCGTETTDADIANLMINKKRASTFNQRSFETAYIPVQFHLVANSSGNGRIAPDRVFEGLCKLNEDFAASGLQFYFNGEFKYIDNTAMFDMEYPPIPSAVRTLFTLRRVDGAINIFIGNGLASGNSGFYTSSPDIIYMDKRYVNEDDVILAHELGHFFGMPHTFFGWEETDYNPDEPTPLQVFRGAIAYNVEYVERDKNCETSGDFFCGTPADYILDWNGDCNYTGGAVDPDSVLLDPEERNLMGYFSFNDCEQYIFADDQNDAMLANFMNRSEFNGSNITLQSEIDEDIILTSPADDEELPINNIKLVWEETENATVYIVEVSRIPNFFALDVQVVTKENSLQIDDLTEDKKYYWRVIALNETNFCERPESDPKTFRTVEMASITTNIGMGSDFIISPNPLHAGENISIVSTNSTSDLQIIIHNTSGELFGNFKVSLRKGKNILSNTHDLSSGMYFITFKVDHHIYTSKFLII